MTRVLTYGALVATALVLQLTVIDVLPIPGGIAPDLVLLVVVAIALTSGPLAGLVTGFAAGLALDLAPPASHAIGAYALVFCLIGYVCGRAAGEIDRSAFLPLAAMALGAIGGSVLYTVVGMTFGQPGVTWAAARNVVPLSAVYGVLLSPFVLYLVLRLTRLAGQVAEDPAAALARPGSGATSRVARGSAGARNQPKEPRLRPGTGRPYERIGTGQQAGLLAASGRSSDGWGAGAATIPGGRPVRSPARLRFGSSKVAGMTSGARQARPARLRFGSSKVAGMTSGARQARPARLRFGPSKVAGMTSGARQARPARLRFGSSKVAGMTSGARQARPARLRFGPSKVAGMTSGARQARPARLRFGPSKVAGMTSGARQARPARLRFGPSKVAGMTSGARQARQARLRFGPSKLASTMVSGKPGVFSGGSLVGGSPVRLRLGTGRASRLRSHTRRIFGLRPNGYQPARPRFGSSRSGAGRSGTGGSGMARSGIGLSSMERSSTGRSGIMRLGRTRRFGGPRFSGPRFSGPRFSGPRFGGRRLGRSRSRGPRSGWMRSGGSVTGLRRGGRLSGMRPRRGWSAIWRIGGRRTGGFR